MSAKIHPVFHVSQFKKQIGPAAKSQPLLEGLSEEEELIVQPEAVLKYRYSPSRRSRAANKMEAAS